MQTIGRDVVAATLTPSITIDAMRAGFLALHRNEVVAPDEFFMAHPDRGEIHVKGAHLHGSPWMVTKVATGGFPSGGNHGCFLAIGSHSGAIEVLVDDGGLLTELRTAAAVALTVDLLARGDAATLAIVGSGVQAGFQLEAVRTVREFGDVRVHSRTHERAESFAAAHGIRACRALGEALDGADVVLLATTSRTPIITDVTQLGHGTHVTASGADTTGKVELAGSVIERADVVAVDDRDLAARVGMLRQAPHRETCTIGELLDGRPGRTSDDQVTAAGLVGLGVQDAAIFAALLTHAVSATQH